MNAKELKRYIKFAEKRTAFHIVDTAGYYTEDVDVWTEKASYVIKDLVNILRSVNNQMGKLIREKEIYVRKLKEMNDEQKALKDSINNQNKHHHTVKRISELEGIVSSLLHRIEKLERKIYRK